MENQEIKEENRKLAITADIIQLFRLMNPNIPGQAISTFFAIIKHHPKPVPLVRLPEELGMTQGSLSRNITTLRTKTPKRPYGLGLISTSEDADDGRAKKAELTPKGEQLRKSILNLLNNI